MGDNESPNSSSTILGRPFLKIANKIDVCNGTFSMEFDGEVIKFNIYDAIQYHSDVLAVGFIDVIEPWFEITNLDLLDLGLHRNITVNAAKELLEKLIVEKQV